MELNCIIHEIRFFIIIFVFLQPKTHFLFYGNATDQEDEKITRNIFLSQPVVTDKFRMIIRSAPETVVFKFDVIGMSPNKRYDTDPILTPQLFEEGKHFGVSIIILLTERHISVKHIKPTRIPNSLLLVFQYQI